MIPVKSFSVTFSAFTHHVLQNMNTKNPDSVSLCWNGSKKYHAEDWAMNDDVDIDDEPFRNVSQELTQAIWR